MEYFYVFFRLILTPIFGHLADRRTSRFEFFGLPVPNFGPHLSPSLAKCNHIINLLGGVVLNQPLTAVDFFFAGNFGFAEAHGYGFSSHDLCDVCLLRIIHVRPLNRPPSLCRATSHRPSRILCVEERAEFDFS
jgi:hypothetical protein